ncbi:sporulation integral membrane protein YtvI [Melghiribacillus thermohalophilus]|uniref:Sporulation integral membrane protein YtvI n=1 Tax=Melghiribacillus thermohalophilus TaxID=1324956 RepID=A0A4R3ND40_9BACI|nr:sporulation integral membrane protein YtvI [Melghiribacillus thermohalophilus]TCT26903.1 sporulation integral membrane protein YtvI [Melghiribacillus thermohalophilus]
MFKKISKKQWTIISMMLLILIISYFILPVSVPFIVAYVTALLLNPLVRWFSSRFKFSRKLSVTIVFLLFLILMTISGLYVTTKAVSQLNKIAENTPEYINNVSSFVTNWQQNFDTVTRDLPQDFIDEINDTIEESFNRAKSFVTNELTIDNIAGFAAKIPNYLVSILVYLIALFLFLLEMPTLRQKFYNFLTDETAEKVGFMSARLSYVVFGFLKAQFLVSLIIFAVSLIGLLFIAPDVAVIMSLIIWLIDFIPIIGSIVILAPWSLYMYVIGDPVTGTKLAVLAIILLAIRRTVEPKIMGRHMGLSPLATLIAMYLGLKLIGIFGFILGPLLVIAFNSAKEAGIIKLNFKV